MLKITKENFLQSKGYSEDEWMLVEPAKAKELLGLPKSELKMYEVSDKKAIAAFGKGWYLVSKPWFNENNVEQTQQEIPTAPAPAPSAPKAEKKFVMITTDFTEQQYLDSGWTREMLVNDGKAKWEVVPQAPKAPSAPAPKAPQKPSVPKPITTEEVQQFLCKQEAETGERCEEQCNDCETTVEDKENFEADELAQEMELARQELEPAKGGLSIDEKIKIACEKLDAVRLGHKLVNQKVGLSVPVNLIENMDDERFNKELEGYIKIVEAKTLELNSPKVKQTGNVVEDAKKLDQKINQVAKQLNCVVVGNKLQHKATNSTIDVDEFQNLDGKELENFIANAQNDIEEAVDMMGKLHAEENKGKVVEMAPKPAPAPKPEKKEEPKEEPKPEAPKAPAKPKEEKETKKDTKKSPKELDVPTPTTNVSESFQLVDSFVSILSRYKKLEFHIAEMKEISENGGRNTLKDIRNVLNKL